MILLIRLFETARPHDRPKFELKINGEFNGRPLSRYTFGSCLVLGWKIAMDMTGASPVANSIFLYHHASISSFHLHDRLGSLASPS